MGTYVVAADIPPRAGGRPLSATTVPSVTDVGLWIDQAEAELLGTLARASISASYAAGSGGFKQIQGWVANYIAGLVRVSNAAAGGDGGNDDGRELVREWNDRLKEIRGDPEGYRAQLDPNVATSDEATALGSHLQDASLGLTKSDVRPTFSVRGNDF